VTATAVPAPGYEFDHWEGNLGGIANPAVISMGSDKSVTAVFMQSSARYTITSGGDSKGGRVELKPVQPDDGYPINTQVTVTAIADSGYMFSEWQGDLVGTANPGSVTVDGDKAITAIFKSTVGISFRWWWIVIAIVLLIGVVVGGRFLLRLLSQGGQYDYE
jgi:hypothetical protein